MIFHEDQYYLFFSAFYFDRWKERSHVVGVSTQDWVHFSDPLFIIDGRKSGWTGMCSPNISRVEINNEIKFILTFNSWGDRHPNGKKNTLFYMESLDMVHWSQLKPIAQNLTRSHRAIDIALTQENDHFLIVWKERINSRKPRDRARIARCSDLDGEFQFIEDGFAHFSSSERDPAKYTQENFQFLRIDGEWCLLTTDYSPHHPMLYKMKESDEQSNNWLQWARGTELLVPKEQFNTNHRANAAFLCDWRDLDGYFYLLYAGRTEGRSHKRRGNNTLGLARSKDLKSWTCPPL